MIPVLQLKGLKKLHEGAEQPIFSHVTAEIANPDMVALLGVSGQGKSTLLRILASLDKADEGEILLHNDRQQGFDPRRWRMKVCYVAQQPVMLEGTVEHNLKTVSLLHRIPYDQQLAAQLLDTLGLEYLDLTKNAADLSGGEKQRISLIRSLLLHPEVLLLDEITASLDRGSKQSVEQLLLEWHVQEGTTMIWVTHDLEQAKHISRTIWFMGEGTLLESSPTDVFFAHPSTETARRFIQGQGVEQLLRSPSEPINEVSSCP